MAEQYNYTYTENPYLKDAYAAETAAADAAAIAYQSQANSALAQAKQTQLQSNKGATADYYANINPYGVQAEALGRSGLGGGLSQSNMIRGYADYTNRLGVAKDAYENAEADIDTSVQSEKARTAAGKLTSKARYNANLATDMRQDESAKFDIWQDRQDRQYRKGRDAIEDRRYEREWAYNHRKAKKKSAYDPNVDMTTAYNRYKNKSYSDTDREQYRKLYFSELSRKAEEHKRTVI